MGRIVFDFIWISLLCSVLLGLISYYVTDIGGGGMIATVVGAMSAGQLHARRTGARVTSGFAWKVASVLTLVSMAIGAAGLFAIRAAGLEGLPETTTLAVIFLILGFISFLVIRLCFGLGVRMGTPRA